MRGFAAFLIILAILVALYLPVLQQARDTGSPRMQCSNCLKSVSLALYNYHEANGTFPPLAVRDSNGTSIHSWRALVAPHILDDFSYDFSEPWNSEKNLKLNSVAPEIFACFRCQGDSEASTTVLAVVGNDTCWPELGTVSKADIRDGANSTIQLMSVPETGIHWLEPRDITIDVVRGASPHGDGNPVAFADGSVGFLPSDSGLLEFASIAGGEKVDRSKLDAIPD